MAFVLKRVFCQLARPSARSFGCSTTTLQKAKEGIFAKLTPAEQKVIFPKKVKDKFTESVDGKINEEVLKIIQDDESLQSPDYFQVYNLFTVKDLFEARVHLGHKVGSFNTEMRDFVFGSRFDTIIFDLDKTAYHLRLALNFIAHIAYRRGIILFMSRSPQTVNLVEKTAIECGEYAHCREFDYSVLLDTRAAFGGITRQPDLILLLNTLDTVMAQHEIVLTANKTLIPVVGIVDSNCSPNLITYPIPGNDDSLSSITLYCKLFKEAILRGKSKRKLMDQKLISSTTDSKPMLNEVSST